MSTNTRDSSCVSSAPRARTPARAPRGFTLGVAHLHELLQSYGGDPIKALAAYNGGEAAVAKWQARFGTLDADEFVESITYRETRDYVKRVIGNYRRYQLQYAQR